MSLMNARPHPGLLPQEKEKRPPRFGHADALGFRAVSSANNKKAAIAAMTNELSKNSHRCSLSPGRGSG